MQQLGNVCPRIVSSLRSLQMVSSRPLDEYTLRSQFHQQWCPQGSVLGPLLFLIHVNNIVADINANIALPMTRRCFIQLSFAFSCRGLRLKIFTLYTYATVQRFGLLLETLKKTVVVTISNRSKYHPPFFNNIYLYETGTHNTLGCFSVKLALGVFLGTPT